MADQRITIAAGRVYAFAVTIEPPLSEETADAEFETHKEAYGYAAGLRMTHSLPIEDRTA